jgi:hypothetical protein
MICLILLLFLALDTNYTLERNFCTVAKENIFPLLEVKLHVFTYYNYSATKQKGILVLCKHAQMKAAQP